MWKKVSAKELSLRSEVRMKDSPYMVATVKQIEGDYITLFRPYVATADFEYTGGVITYIGIEEYKIHSSTTVEVWDESKKEK